GEETVRLTHTVCQGENLREIARRYGVSATDIKRLNQLRGGNIQPGQQLVIETVGRLAPDEAEVEKSETLTALAAKPAPAAAAEPERATVRGEEKARQNTSRTTQPSTTTHKVRKGDTLGALAARYHTTVAAIQGVNGMKKNNTSIRVGQVLKIPAKGSTTKAPSKKKKSSRRRR
ncbi:MAG: LysM peptidoglycan-binding domain-containing protein, partial [Duncaniella sp.]|nr:LysM peptidoglycan-binding domain-containing protein [Duncaniella sp.]